MIDTDKYEGHIASEGQTWAWSKWMLKNAETIEQHKATSALLNDAPLLLAEVKRLREKLESIQNSMAWTVQVWWNENYMGREGWMKQMCEVYADLAKGIEAQYHGEEEE